MTFAATQDSAPVGGSIFVIDPDAECRASMSHLLQRLANVQVVPFASAEEFLANAKIEPPACVITDVRLPGMSGLELLSRLTNGAGPVLPMLFVASHGDIRTAVQAVRLGALDFLEKPCIGRVLLRAVQGALRRSAQQR